VSYLSQQANAAGIALPSLAITPAQVARVITLVEEGTLTNKLARQVVDGVLAGEGEPDEVVEARGLAVVSDEGALMTAVDEAIEADVDAAEKIRGGKVQAVGALVGRVMKATRGQADASVVRRLLLERLGVSE
jgi:aspartyl-tRNA(Asn)/glutamyl-tRNA(Gln) amidotransferase subunit B